VEYTQIKISAGEMSAFDEADFSQPESESEPENDQTEDLNI